MEVGDGQLGTTGIGRSMRFWQQRQSCPRSRCTRTPPGLVEDKSQDIPAVTSGNQRYNSTDSEAPPIQTYGSTAVLATKVVTAGSTKGQPSNNRLRLLHVCVEQGGKWMRVASQTTCLA